TIYVNGEKRYDKTTYATWGAIDDITSADFNYSNVINLIKSAVNFYLGYGSWWGSSPLLIDDLSIYNGVLTDTEVTDLYNSYTKIENFVFDSEINWIYDKQANTISINGLKGDKKIELLNLTGQVISSTKQSTIYTGNLNKGVYLLKIKEGNASSVKKIMIL
ncbi:MAG: T9SS type A sorting domain-containing protein, partial [Dysgonamonadaceae bacterium]|nr:T9SS type A sorting domain-containing protein [Dysgonamonadaceae bacterium]